MFISCFNVRGGGLVIIPVTLSSCNNKKESNDGTFKEPEVYLKDQFEVRSGDSYIKHDKNLNDSNFIFCGTGNSSGSFTTSFDELFVIKNKPLDLISLHGGFSWSDGIFNNVDIRDYHLSDYETIGWKITCGISDSDRRNTLSIVQNAVQITYWNSKLDEEETFSDIIKNVPTSVTLVRA